MGIKTNPCKYISEDGTACLSPFHSRMWHNPPKPIKRTSVKPKPFQLEKPKPRKKPAKYKTKSRSQLVKELDDVFSKYIRQKYAIDGYTACVTCGVVKRWQEQQCGHYMSRGNLPTRWDETNCHPQCVACNVFKKGNYTEYAIFMINTYGVEKLTELKANAKSCEKIPTLYIKANIEKYRSRLV